jgi:hypothetical protein
MSGENMCNVCRHNQTQTIDRLLLAGASPAAVGAKYGFSPAALQRHQEHLAQKMAQAEKRFHASLHQGLLCKLNIVLELVLGVVHSAQAGGDFKLCLQATREVNRITKLMLKMDVRLDPEMIYCLVASPQWDLQDSLLPDAFTSLVQTRETLKTNLFAPCPEPDPDPVPAVPPETPGENRQPASGQKARPKRDKSATGAPKTADLNSINEEYQVDMLNEKNIPAKRDNLFQKFFRRWEKSGKLPGKTGSDSINIELSQ